MNGDINSNARAFWVLWAHVVSEHANCIDGETLTFEDLCEYHEREHRGPGGIRTHSDFSRGYNLRRIGKVLSEAEDTEVE